MRHEPYNKIEHRDYVISIFCDENPESPREWDNLGTMYTAHRHYCPEKELDDHFNINDMFKSRWEFREKFLRTHIALPVYMLDHRGINQTFLLPVGQRPVRDHRRGSRKS